MFIIYCIYWVSFAVAALTLSWYYFFGDVVFDDDEEEKVSIALILVIIAVPLLNTVFSIVTCKQIFLEYKKSIYKFFRW